MELKTLINYYNTCPICNGNIIINTDLSIPSTIDKQEDGLLLSVYEDAKEPLKFKLLYSNRIEGDRPYILSTPYSIVRRQLCGIPAAAYDRLQLELACIDCGNFRYWSNNIIFDPVEKTMNDLSIRWERAELKHKKDHLILSNDLRNEELTVYTPNKTGYCKIPYVGTFKGLPLKDTEGLILQIKKQLIVS